MNLPLSFLFIALLLLPVPAIRAQTASVSVIHQFTGFPDGAESTSGLLRGSDGDFYGTASGGTYGAGVVFRLDAAGTVTLVHSFNGDTEGGLPFAGLVLGTDGNFYGTNASGGADGNGVAFRVTPAGAYTVLHDFADSDGQYPFASMVQGPDGNFYGTMNQGGANSLGVVFEMTPDGAYIVLHDLAVADGANPYSPLAVGTDGALYGTTYAGGKNGTGTIFKVMPGGDLIVLHDFSGYGPGNTDGYAPFAGLTLGTDGNFYGTANGGSSAGGVFFQMTPAGNLTVVHNFFSNTEGSQPSGVIQGSDGQFYGTTSNGGANVYYGTVFRVSSTGTFTLLHSFNGTDGHKFETYGVMAEGAPGEFYGVTDLGGQYNQGTAFNVSTAGDFTSLHSFSLRNARGAGPCSPLTQAGDGNFYGGVAEGGGNAQGAIYKMTPAGQVTLAHSFKVPDVFEVNTDGFNPARMIVGKDGNLYGTTVQGGSMGAGTAFRYKPGGALTTLCSFGTVNGVAYGKLPYDGLIQGSDGNFYGTTTNGGANGYYGTVFRLKPGGALSNLYSFDYTDGASPHGVVQGGDGNFYGVTGSGGTNGKGTFYRLTAAGVLTTLYQFNATNPDGSNSGGADPLSGLIAGSDGTFYGTTSTGGVHGAYGTIFRVTAAGGFSVLHNFNGADGTFPKRLWQGADGNFYGTTGRGGLNGYGTIFQLTAAGKFTTLHHFVAAEGADASELTQGADGQFYGTTGGGVDHQGAVFRFAVVLPPVVTNAASASATQGQPFTYRITASNAPTSFGVVGLPPGLKVDAKTGVISGTPTGSGTKKLTLKAANAAGMGQEVLTLTITQVAPVITSAGTASGKVGQAFSYRITVDYGATSFGVVGLPPGLKVDGKTGLISGTPTGAGTHAMTLKAANAAGIGQKKLTLTVAK